MPCNDRSRATCNRCETPSSRKCETRSTRGLEACEGVEPTAMRGFLACLGALAVVCAVDAPPPRSSRARDRLRADRRRVARERPRHDRRPRDDARRARRPGRPLHGALGPGRADRAGGSRRSAGPRLRLVGAERRARRACTRAASTSSCSSTVRRRGRTAASRRTTCRRARAVRRLRHGGRARVPVGQEVPDLERAEPGALAAADLGAALRDAPPEPRVHRDPRGDPGAKVAGGGHCAARLDRRRLAGRLDHRDASRARARLDAYAHNPYPLDPKRETPLHAPPCANCTTVTMATLSRLERLVARDFPRARIWLTEYGYQSNPPDRMLGVSPGAAGALRRRRARTRRTARRASTC